VKIGVFLCQCGPNISEKIDLEKVGAVLGASPDVALAHQENFPCSPAGRAAVVKLIQENGLTHCVFGACSHREHEQKTFARIMSEAGLNPFMMEMANLREHCAWVIADKEAATARAIYQMKAALAKVRHNKPLEQRELDVNPAIAVIGGGIAGIKAAKLAARDGRQVYLIEREASVGGKMPQWEKSFPTMDCNPCFLAPEISSLGEIKNIEIITSATVEDAVGFFGSFTLKVRQAARGVTDSCMACGECEKACPVRVPNPFDFGLSQRGAIHMPFPGCMPASSAIEKTLCLRQTTGEDCKKCQEACLFGAIDFTQEDQLRTLEVGAVILATGFSLPDLKDKPALGAHIENVVTSAQLERLLSSTGPTRAHLKLANGETPKSVTIVTCAGRGDYCSKVCCAAALKYAKYLVEHDEKITVNIVHHDMALAGDGYQRFAEEVVSQPRTTMMKSRDWKDVKVVAEGAARTVVFKEMNGQERKVSAEMVVLSVGMLPAAGNAGLLAALSVETDKQGFVAKNHGKMDPNMSGIEGVFIGGSSGGPKDEAEAVMSGEAAAGQAISRLVPGAKIKLEIVTAYADADLCSGCQSCVRVCPYKAIVYDPEKRVVSVSEVLCKGCGTCVAACPSAAMQSRHFGSRALQDSLQALLGN
jgi:heterodisulfide reductase subunit A